MATSTSPSPLHGPAPVEVHLPRAPLACVIAQVRFPSVLMIGNVDAVAPLQELLRHDYPGVKRQEGQNVLVDLGAEGPTFKVEQTTVWRFHDAAEEWIATLAVNALTLETRAYTTRADMMDRLGRLIDAVTGRFTLASVEGASVRYVTRMTGEGYERMDQLIRPELLGLSLPALREDVRHAISEAAMNADEGAILLRWGVMSAGGSVDPVILPPVAEPSWIIDIDVSNATPASFDAPELATTFEALAERAYAIFRHVVTDHFLELYGREQ